MAHLRHMRIRLKGNQCYREKQDNLRNPLNYKGKKNSYFDSLVWIDWATE